MHFTSHVRETDTMYCIACALIPTFKIVQVESHTH